MNRRPRLSGKASLVRRLLVSGLLLGLFCAVALADESATGSASAGENTAQPSEGFVPLFDGSSFDGWKHLEGFEGHWVAKDGVISCDGKVDVKRGGERSLWTEKEYADFVLMVDWRLTGEPVRQPMNDFTDDGLIKRDKDGKRVTHEVLHAGDSGVFLRGDPRAQVNIWCQPMGSGDINSYHKDASLPKEIRRACMPRLNADNPPGQWNRFLITMRGTRVTVVLNGKTVIDRAALPGVAERGPIGLQNHGDPVEFRNLFIKPLPAGSPNAPQAPAQPAQRTDWFHQAGWGVMTHYLGAPPSSSGGAELTAEAWNRQVDACDVEALANQLASTGAKYLLFTIGQNSGHYCAPNATYDKLVGITPSKCSRRDLVADLAEELKERGMRLMVYLPSGAPAADPEARTKLGWRWGRPGGWQLPGEPVGGRLAEFQEKWEAVVREWSLRWKKDVSGWWIDGCYFADEMYRFDDPPNFASFAAALRAGNPESIVAFNPGVLVPVVAHSKYEDYAAGEVNLNRLPEAVATCPGRWLERDGAKVQYHILTFLGESWCRGERPQWPDDKIIGLTRQVLEKGGVITFDVPIEKSGLIPQPFIEQLRAIGQAVR